MACCLDEETRDSLGRCKEIDRQLEQWKKDSEKEYKLLLLGTSEAGKTTFIMQLRLIHGQGYTAKDRAELKVYVYKNVFETIEIMVEAMRKLKIAYQSPTNQTKGEELALLAKTEVLTVGTECRDKIIAFWEDEGVQTCFDCRRELQILDSAKYFDELERILADDYVPTLQDALRVHVPTTSIREYTFCMRRDVVFRMIDVTGQRNEMRKWIHYFEGVKAVMFLVAISEYDQVLQNQNRLQESLSLFETIITYPWFVKSSIIVIFNETDLFQEKIMTSDIVKYFPAYSGPARDPEAGKSFIASLFLSANTDPERRIFHHFTCATDTENLRRMFEDVKTHVLEENNNYNLM